MNRLSTSTSPYLLQHANNPVHWYPWGTEALEKAQSENKLILVSIGYSACHWCHVMEHESFEDVKVAELMNQFFVCIKIDREERPDIDQIYMTAIQLMTGRGGWPLNCFCLPNQQPIYGGTYFLKQDWKNLLLNLAQFWDTKPHEAQEYATRLTHGIIDSDKIKLIGEQKNYTLAHIEEIVKPWKMLFDFNNGGYNQAPKFPMPNNWAFLMQAAYLLKDVALQIIVSLTLDKMAAGGIYDHLRGGFARYSVDSKWHIPHFEKMLYDNGQLVSLYADAYKWNPKPRYKEVVYETLAWVADELTSPEGGFYSALDADSEGVEGKFYVWNKTEIDTILGADASVFNAYYGVSEAGNWEEEDTNHLYTTQNNIAEEFGLTDDTLQKTIQSCKQKLLTERAKRIRPGLDDKILTSWNAMMLKGYIDAYKTFAEPEFLKTALANANFIKTNMLKLNGGLFRSYKNRVATINGFLDDYAHTIEAFIALYEVTFDEIWLHDAQALSNYVLANFIDDETGMFFYTSAHDQKLIARKYELMDNVIPASNSVMAHNFKKLGLFFDIDSHTKIYTKMLQNIHPKIKTYGSGYSNWASLLLMEVIGDYQIVITGKNFKQNRLALEQQYIPNKIILGGLSGTLPLLKNKLSTQNTIFVCQNKTCLLPVSSVNEALNKLNN
ncbi:MAG: thioredoxin domain-containing protein [Sphingobacteriales bacterium]|nr:MAG: thioredoxin domain-containing protein [Sphingobacteriales bacterium]TAF78386.1 MAG: thioredoxin domain-containing protein [Sphingobacteriales bacterium]